MRGGMHAAPAMQAAHLAALQAEIQRLTPSLQMEAIHHAASMTAREKQALLPHGVWVQKSVSVLIGPQLFLFSGTGDFRVERWQMRAVARRFALSAAQAHHHVLNPSWLPAEHTSGLAEGMVSPFFPPAFRPAFTAVVLLPPAPEGRPADQVAISTSLASSVLFPAMHLPDLVCAYGLRYYPQVPVVSLPQPAHSTFPAVAAAPMIAPQVALSRSGISPAEGRGGVQASKEPAKVGYMSSEKSVR